MKIENTSIISSASALGDNVKIGRFCIIEKDVRIEDNVVIGDYTLIGYGSRIGANTQLGAFTKIGHDADIGKKCNFSSYCEIRDKCKIGDNVIMGSRCTLSAGTIVESDVIVKYSSVVADTPDLTKDDEKQVGCIKTGARIGANVTIMPGVIVGKNSVIGACSQVRHNVPDNEVWYGNPAKFYKKMITG